MAKQPRTEYTCDLCASKDDAENGKLPECWVELCIENRYVDRDFTDKHVCDECCLTITKKHPG